MNNEELKKKLKKEGFRNIFVWCDGPNTIYPDHTHPTENAHIIIEGEMELTMAGKTYRLRPGDRLDVPPGEIHSAEMSPEGCTYIVGER